jgi:cytochrome bd-type quinol oxidase subunit 1
MNLKTRKRLSLLILVIGLPLYVVVAVTLMNWLDTRFGRQPILIEVGIYVMLGILWALPFKKVFRGVGKGE